jgi:hypothetical protein
MSSLLLKYIKQKKTKLFYRYFPTLLTMLIILFLFVTWYPQHISENIFVNDDADYAYAAKQGLFANAWDLNALPVKTFLNLGFEKGMANGQRSSLSEFIRASNAVTFYRHYHGPLYFYGLTAAMNFSLDEQWLRFSGLFWLLFLAAVTMGSQWIMFPQKSLLLPTLVGGVIGLSYTGFSAATLLTGHVAFACFVLMSLVAAGKWLSENDQRWLIGSGVTGGMAFAVIEYALLIPFSILIATLLQKWNGPELKWKTIARDSVIWACSAVITLFIVWPAGILKLSIIKNYVVSVYVVLVRNEAFGGRSMLEAWWIRIVSDPLTYGFVLVGLLCSLHILLKQVKLRPLIIFATLIFLTTFKNTATTPTYTIALLGVAVCLSTIGLGLRAEQYKINFGLIALPVLLLSLILVFTRDYNPPDGQDVVAGKSWHESITGIVDFQKKHGPVLVIRGIVPTLHYYHPELKFDSYVMPNGSMNEPFERIATGGYAGVYIWWSGHEKFASEFSLMDHDYRLIPTGLRGLFIIENSSLES